MVVLDAERMERLKSLNDEMSEYNYYEPYKTTQGNFCTMGSPYNCTWTAFAFQTTHRSSQSQHNIEILCSFTD